MPENSSKTQSKESDPKSVKIESTAPKPKSEEPKTSNLKKTPKTQGPSDQKTKSRLPNKSLTDAEVKKKSENPTPKSEKSTPKKNETPKSDSQTAKSPKLSENSKTSKVSKPKPNSNKSSIKIITKKSGKSGKTEKKETQNTSGSVSKSTAESITVKTKSSTKLCKTPPTSAKTTIKVIKTPKSKNPARIPTNPIKPQNSTTSKISNLENKKSQSKTTKPTKPSFLLIFSQVIATILGFSSLFLIGMLVNLNVLPTHYLILAVLLILVIAGGFGFLLVRKKTSPVIKVPINVLSVLFSCVYLVGGGYLAEASGFLDSLKPQEYVSEQYYIVVKNDSNIQDIAELKDQTIGTFDEGIELYQEAIKELNDTVSVNLKDFQSAHAMADNLLSDSLDAIFISAIHKSVIDEDSSEFSQGTRILYTIEVKVKAENVVEHPNIDVTSEPFTIYISGNDSYGDLTARGLSDVNMLVTVNPVTHEILLTSIPRDCFVQLHGTTGTKDKLTHAGMYGVQMSILTIEDLLDIDIDYYVKINFPALISLVDAIGGIDVYSDKTFKPLHGDEIVKEGMNHFDGAMALAFARERMAYSYGDRHRVQNQRDVLNAIIQKVSSSSVILTRTSEILNSLSSNLDTNISKSEISGLVKLQLDSMPSWQIAEYMVNGSDLYTYTYTFDDMPRYVMPPYPESIQTAHDYITGIMDGKTIKELGIPEPEKSWK